MTPINPLKSALEELSGMHDVQKMLTVMIREAERRQGEAEINLNALLMKCRSVVAVVIDQHQGKVDRLRAEAEQQEAPKT